MTRVCFNYSGASYKRRSTHMRSAIASYTQRSNPHSSPLKRKSEELTLYLQIADKGSCTNLSVIGRFHCSSYDTRPCKLIKPCVRDNIHNHKSEWYCSKLEFLCTYIAKGKRKCVWDMIQLVTISQKDTILASYTRLDTIYTLTFAH